MKVLVIQQRMGIGDMIIFLPYIHAISKKFQSQVSLLVKKNSKAEQLCLDDQRRHRMIVPFRAFCVLYRTSINSCLVIIPDFRL